MNHRGKVMNNDKRKSMFQGMSFLLLVICCALLIFAAPVFAQPDWYINLRVESGTAYNNLVLGGDNTATDGFDNVWEVYAYLGGTVRAYFPHPEWGSVQNIFWRDIRMTGIGTEKTWSLTVDSDLAGGNFTISWDMSAIPQNYIATFTDDASGGHVDMQTTSSYNFVYSSTATFTISVTPAGCVNQPVRIAGTSPTYYDTLTAAYAAAATGDTIQSQAVTLVENLNITGAGTVMFEGGYDCNYSSVEGVTTVSGTMTITNGNNTFSNFAIQ